jgi:hypothetical protein
VSRQNASRWHALWRAGGQDALRRTGRAPRLCDQQLAAIDQALPQGEPNLSEL